MPFTMYNTVGLDFETYGSVNLPTHGLENYVSDPFFKPLIARVVLYKSPTHRVDLRIDFINYGAQTDMLYRALQDKLIAGHNVPFEQRVLARLGIHLPAEQFVDSAVVSRVVGGGSSLSAAALQLLNADKMEEGKDLIKLFSIPGKYQEANNSPSFDNQVVDDHPDEWALFGRYCTLDAQLSLDIVLKYGNRLTEDELKYAEITEHMNRMGWPVDLDMVAEMQRRYLVNQEDALKQFRLWHDAADLNLNSLKQLKEWCADRGIKATSFDEKHVASLLARLEKKLATDLTLDQMKRADYGAVRDLLLTKQTLGGSSLKKLQVILNNVSEDGRLRDQYLHAGAGQTLRTSGRNVQMQNLKRLTTPKVMEALFEESEEWTNTELAENLRQVFTSSHPDGALIVGDFSSVESRGLAYLAGEEWKLDAFRKGQDLYKVLAAKIYDWPYNLVDKTQRQTGKVGELSCGYGAGPGAVLEFAKNMGVEMTEGESTKLVNDWRAANPRIIDLWSKLDSMLHETVEQGTETIHALPHDGLTLFFRSFESPKSLQSQHPNAKSLEMVVIRPDGQHLLRRYFHGVYVRGRNVCYYKPSDRKTGDVWKQSYIDPKTKQRRFYDIYGGKLAGILTQSFCREIFFDVLRQVARWTEVYDNLTLLGQFHDEIVLDWWPTPGAVMGLVEAEQGLHSLMTNAGQLQQFPLGAEIKHDYRYTK